MFIRESYLKENQMKLSELVTVMTLPREEDIKSALEVGTPFQYEKKGAINYLFHNGEPIRFLTTLEFVAGKERGGHYHKEKEDNLLVTKGVLKGKFSFPNGHETFELIIGPGDIVKIRPGVVHSYVSDEGASAIEFSPQALDISDQIDV